MMAALRFLSGNSNMWCVLLWTSALSLSNCNFSGSEFDALSLDTREVRDFLCLMLQQPGSVEYWKTGGALHSSTYWRHRRWLYDVPLALMLQTNVFPPWYYTSILLPLFFSYFLIFYSILNYFYLSYKIYVSLHIFKPNLF